MMDLASSSCKAILNALIVGDLRDSHVRSVISAVEARSNELPFVIDAPAMQRQGFSLDLERLRFEGRSIPINSGGRGWLRRYAPTAWGTGTVAGSLEAVTRRAFVALVGSVSRLGTRTWLTDVGDLLCAEDRLVQLEVARSLGIRVPDSLVTSSAEEAADRFAGPFVLKPIAGGYFWANDGPRAVFAQAISREAIVELDFAAAPFVAQERLDPLEHLRVVTVGSQAWVGALSAGGRPLDWRREEEAHRAWQPRIDPAVEELAIELAQSLKAGYSSQDWIRDRDGLAFLDLNPGGQWLFLPEPISEPVTQAIAIFLSQSDR